MIYSFKNDYAEGAHLSIIQKLIETNEDQQNGYGDDAYSKEAKEILRSKLSNEEAEIFFLSGGTQTNLIVISAILRVHEAVISAKTGHIYANETGAIEATGHRIITIETANGKLTPQAIQDTLNQYTLRPHVVKPKMVYISNSTEIGTIYHKSELIELFNFCASQDLYLFLDGARLGHALCAEDSDLTLADIGKYTHVFYIGGTKNGALLGEAVVFNYSEIAKDFDYVLKQKGALLAKGRLLGIQFLELFQCDLYFTLARHANVMAQKIAAAFASEGYEFLTPSTTNQIFPILPLSKMEKLQKHYDFYIWKYVDEQHAAIRIITSWATPENIVQKFIQDIEEL